MNRKTALLGSSLATAAVAVLAAIATPTGAQAANGPVQPYYGNLRPFYGNLRPFYGNLRPFYGNLRPFWGDLQPFWGNTAAFYGDLSTFWGTSNPVVGAGAPDYTKVADFWTSAGDNWDKTFTAWGALDPSRTSAAGYQPIADQIKGLVDTSRGFWGASVQAKSGKSFDVAFANPLLAKYGIDLSDPNSLSKLDQTDQALFFLDWYDGLMNYVGTDHVDWWMKTVNWSPELTKTESTGAPAVIGLLDFTVTGDASLQQKIVKYDGVSNFTNGHGAAVASLMVGAEDGTGVMGVAPHSSVVAYNPFDATGTANWTDITNGISMLKSSGANVVNMSLGVPGKTFDQGWNTVFTNPKVSLILKNTVFVIAAGNDGVTQTADINWNPLNPAFIVVGSVDASGNISNFSNRPGDACLKTLGLLCLPGQHLRDHFIVAPGDMILVDDGAGGVTRQIGTSFAAPLVSGAVALLQDRWPWLVNFPRETVDIILKSAKDLGAPGVDDVYGYGLLDITASQSPLDFNNLIWFSVQNGVPVPQTSKAVLNTYKSQQQATWDAKGAYFYAFEPIGLTQRDFAIPLSQKLIGQDVTTLSGAHEQFQAYLLSRMDDWAAGQGAGKLALASPAFGFVSGTVAVPNRWGADLSLSYAPRRQRLGFQDNGPAYQSALRLSTEHASLAAGFGDGAPALFSQSGFTQAADYDTARGGANPLLGLASGGAYATWSYGISDKVRFSAGALTRDDRRDLRLTPALGVAGNGAERYQAAAQHFSLSYTPAAGVTLTGGYTHLHEGQGLLGIQSYDPQDFHHGTDTDGVSVSVDWAATTRLSLMATGTVGRTRQGDANAATLSVAKGGLTSSAFEVGAVRRDLFTAGDRLQVSVSQPMYVERGRLNLTTVQVVDRETGEIGVATQSLDISGKRRLAGEALYLRPLSHGRADFGVYGRVETGPQTSDSQAYVAGARYRIAF